MVEQWDLVRAALRRLLVWMLVALPPVAVLDRLYADVRFTPYDLKIAAFERLAPELEIVVLGTSQMIEGVDPRELGASAFNMASGSQDVHYDAQVLATFAPRLPRLRVVVWGLSLFSFGYDIAKTPGEERLMAYHYDRYFARRDGSHGGFWSRFALLGGRGDDPIRGWVTLAEAALAGPSDPVASWVTWRGFYPAKQLLRRSDDGAVRWKFHSDLAHQRPLEDNLAILVRATNRLRARGIRVVFVAPPLSPTYAGPGDMGRLFDEGVRRLVAETRAELHDLRRAVPPTDQTFRNADHLQGEGTRLFSRELARILR